MILSSQNTTVQGLLQEIQNFGQFVVEKIKENEILKGRSPIFIQSQLEQYLQHMNRNFPQMVEIQTLKKELYQIGEQFAQNILQITDQVAKKCLTLMKNGAVILVLGYSRLMEMILIESSKQGFRFKVIVPQFEYNHEGITMANILAANNIQVKLIQMGGIGFHMDQIDFVLTGAEAVVANGGIINRIGTQTVALSATYYRKPFYVVCESFKFTKLFPLCQNDITQELLFRNDYKENDLNIEIQRGVVQSKPVCDYTFPDLITLLVTDLGIFTPSAVCDELLKIYCK